MSAVATVERTGARTGPHDGETLEQLIGSVWSELGAHRPADCPMCGERIAPEYGIHALPIGGRCGGCGTELR